MPDYGAPHESLVHDRGGLSPLAIFKVFAGAMLITSGAIVGLYSAITVFNLINGDKAPNWVARFAMPVAERAVNEAQAQAQAQGVAQPFDVSPDIKQGIFCLLTFMFLLIPVSVATSLIGNGVKLMQGDAVEALGRIAEKLKKS